MVIRAQVMGFCMGVRRAVDLASTCGGKNVYSLGPLVHNPKVLDDLASLGVHSVESPPENCGGCTVIIRAHGISPLTEKSLRDKGCVIIDATCPKVKASQLKVQELSRAGYFLFLAGEAHHAEIAGLLGYASGSNVTVAGCVSDAENAARRLLLSNNNSKTALIGQTTISEDVFAGIGDIIKEYFPNLKIINTICAATSERQNALRELLPQVDAVIVAGGKDSANTRALFAIARESGKPCVSAESASEIPREFFNYKTVGISAGASTPDSVVEEMERILA